MDGCCHISISVLNISSAQHSDFQSVIGVSLICMLLPGSVLWHNKDIFSSGWEREGGRERKEQGIEDGKEGGSQKMNSNSSVFCVEFCNFFLKKRESL